MDWDDDDGRALPERPAAPDTWRDTWREARGDVRGDRGDPRSTRKGLEERLETWVSRGRDLVDGVSGTRPGTRPGRPAERGGPAGRTGLDGLGRWVEGRLDWLLDDRDDWREPWQEGERPSLERWETPSPPPRPSRAPLQAISRRGVRPASQPGARATPVSPEVAPKPPDLPAGANGTAPGQEWPEPDAFSVPRWRREEPVPPRPANPLAEPAPPPPPGRPLPRSSRRR
jgi:hypothetical protein